MLKELAQKVKDLKKRLTTLHEERSSTSNRLRYEALEFEIFGLTNKVCDAVHDFRHALREEIGVEWYELPDLLRDSGDAIHSSIPLPKAIELDFAPSTMAPRQCPTAARGRLLSRQAP